MRKFSHKQIITSKNQLIEIMNASLKILFENHFGEKVISALLLPQSGSAREYFRIRSKNHKAVGTYYPERKENEAFISFSEHFKSLALNVPLIYCENINENIYLQEDLGDETLFSFLEKNRKSNEFPETVLEYYKKSLSHLADIQIKGAKGLNFEKCVPRKAFDKSSMMWDLNYFKYFFLKLAHIPFDEQLLENDFSAFSDFLCEAESSFFLFRDFQSRNIMIHNNDVFFIDYQGGRKGALAYDVASLLYDAKADLPEEIRELLKKYYIEIILKKYGINSDDFEKYYYGFVLIRMMQAMGAFGYRGIFERKEHFIRSIPFAIKNLLTIFDKCDFLIQFPELKKVLLLLPDSPDLKDLSHKLKLKITVKSFSYKKGIPYDATGNGGGFVFDCRFLDNPGRIEHMKTLCGKDPEVIDFLEKNEETALFSQNIKNLLKEGVEKYINREYSDLSVSFGCTGGRHRSVYFAETTAKYLSENFPVKVILEHTEGF
jgi:aminoglycoside/choline kinase family phosphotransferase